MIEIIETDINISRLQQDVEFLLSTHNLREKRQVSLTSVAGNDDWDCSVGSMMDLSNPERYYSILNKSLEGTYIGDLITQYKKFYRWRLLGVWPGQTYTVHQDTFPGKINKRIHIPVFTNSESFFCFHNTIPVDGSEATIKYHHLVPGTIYELNTSNFHSAVNYGLSTRYHIVGVRYEDLK